MASSKQIVLLNDDPINLNRRNNSLFNSNQRLGSSSHNAQMHASSTYKPPPPKPIMSGFMEEKYIEGDYLKTVWKRKYVEVRNGALRFFQSRDGKDDIKEALLLANCYVSVQDRRNVMLELNGNTVIFRASSKLSAQTWVNVISQFCKVAPTAEGFCMKLSHGKQILEERYLHLAADGILSWYKSEKDDERARGAIQVRGEEIKWDTHDSTILYVETKDRCFKFQFAKTYKAKLWFDRLTWHSYRKPMDNHSIKIRNPSVRK